MKQGMKKKQGGRFLAMSGVLLGLTLLWSAGCSDGVPRRMEADYGRSVTYNRLEMIVTPPDRVDTKPPVGMLPTAAANSQERYNKSFKEKEEPQALKLIFK